MKWENLLSLKRHGDSLKRLRSEQDETRVGFDVDYDRIIFSSFFRTLQQGGPISIMQTLQHLQKLTLL
jgi:dGTPase